MTSAEVGELAEVIEILRNVEDRLSYVAIERLRASIESGDKSLAVDEKQITKARRAVEKAIVVLGTVGGGV